MFQWKLLLLALLFFKISSFEPGEETIGLQQHQDVRWLKGIDIFKKNQTVIWTKMTTTKNQDVNSIPIKYYYMLYIIKCIFPPNNCWL